MCNPRAAPSIILVGLTLIGSLIGLTAKELPRHLKSGRVVRQTFGAPLACSSEIEIDRSEPGAETRISLLDLTWGNIRISKIAIASLIIRIVCFVALVLAVFLPEFHLLIALIPCILIDIVLGILSS